MKLGQTLWKPSKPKKSPGFMKPIEKLIQKPTQRPWKPGNNSVKTQYPPRQIEKKNHAHPIEPDPTTDNHPDGVLKLGTQYW